MRIDGLMLNAISKQIDTAFDEKDESTLQKSIDEINQLLIDEKINSISELILYYNLGNAYSYLDNLRNHRGISLWFYNNTEHINAIKSYRKCIKVNCSDKKLQNDIFMQSYTNLGNMFSESGRIIYAINSWQKALDISPNFGMAQGNLGVGLVEYAKSLYDNSHAFLISQKAYFFLSKSIESVDVYTEAKLHFISYKEMLESHFSAESLKDEKQFPNYFEGISRQEMQYRKWALKNSLFLNPLNDIYYDSFVAHDIIHLPNITTSIYEPPKFHGLFNEIKQQYVSARYMYYSYLQQEDDYDKDFSDKDNLLFDTLDYTLYGYKYELLRNAYKNLYSTLDKIAFFINGYFELNHTERSISFNTIWYEEKQKNKAHIKTKIENLTNNPLRGLYYLSKDFYSYDLEYLSLTDEDAQKLADLRNCLEHRYVKITQFKNNPVEVERYDAFAYQITIDEFKRKTKKLLHYVREAIIYLSLAVHINERKKVPTDGKIVPIIMRRK